MTSFLTVGIIVAAALLFVILFVLGALYESGSEIGQPIILSVSNIKWKFLSLFGVG
jgi:hypothetical protein